MIKLYVEKSSAYKSNDAPFYALSIWVINTNINTQSASNAKDQY